jgi:hypothetical protein
MPPNELSTGGSPGLFAPLLLLAITAGSGWMWRDHLGPDRRDTAEQAFADARAHSADVDPVIGRPLEQPQLPGG